MIRADFQDSGSLPRADRGAPRGQALASLDAFALGERFYSWRGASGARYVCSVFGAQERDALAGFSDAVVIGVRRDAGERSPVCVLASRDFDAVCGDGASGLAGPVDVDEWHVHFGAAPETMADLKASLQH